MLESNSNSGDAVSFAYGHSNCMNKAQKYPAHDENLPVRWAYSLGDFGIQPAGGVTSPKLVIGSSCSIN